MQREGDDHEVNVSNVRLLSSKKFEVRQDAKERGDEGTGAASMEAESTVIIRSINSFNMIMLGWGVARQLSRQGRDKLFLQTKFAPIYRQDHRLSYDAGEQSPVRCSNLSPIPSAPLYGLSRLVRTAGTRSTTGAWAAKDWEIWAGNRIPMIQAQRR